MKIYQLFILLIISLSCATGKINNRIYWINSAKVPCSGVDSMQCFNVQKGETLNWENWQNFYSSIEGFDFEPGYLYKLIVNEKKLNTENVPADASSIKYTLVKILEKKVDRRFKLNDVWILENIQGEKIQFEKTNTHRKAPQIEFDITEMRVNGNDGCNNFFGGIKLLTLETIEFDILASTKRACLETDIPDKFNNAFSLVSKFEIENNRLLLLNNADKQLLVFKKVD